MATTLFDIARQTKYPPAAFEFVERGLGYTVQKIHGEMAEQDMLEDQNQLNELGINSRHISGQQLCYGLRDFAIEQYGLLARGVLRRWHINRSEDFGQIVFTLVENELLRKTDDDSIEDFRDVFDFNDAFDQPVALGDTV